MPVGATIGAGQINNTITAYAVRLRDLVQDIVNLDLLVNGQGAGLAYLTSLGFSSQANAANPGGVSDAQLALSMISYLNTVAKVANGTATQAAQFDFIQETSQVWAGQ